MRTEREHRRAERRARFEVRLANRTFRRHPRGLDRLLLALVRRVASR
jgi:hypothetical protein